MITANQTGRSLPGWWQLTSPQRDTIDKSHFPDHYQDQRTRTKNCGFSRRTRLLVDMTCRAGLFLLPRHPLPMKRNKEKYRIPSERKCQRPIYSSSSAWRLFTFWLVSCSTPTRPRTSPSSSVGCGLAGWPNNLTECRVPQEYQTCLLASAAARPQK